MKDCPCGNGKCDVPNPTLVLWDGAFSLVSHELLKELIPEFTEAVSQYEIRPAEFAIPDQFVQALSMFEAAVAGDFGETRIDFGETGIEERRRPEPTDRRIYVTCQPCGHLCTVEP